MMYLSLPIPRAHRASLQECLDLFTQSEELDSDDWVVCPKTKQPERTMKKLDMWNAPECLIIHLKRFGSQLHSGTVSKIDTFVQAPLALDLSKWVRGPKENHSAQYRLHAVVNHFG